MARINLPGLRREISQQYNRTFARRVRQKVESDVEKAKARMIAAFDSHSVTKDLDGGGGGNLVGGEGDLFSLIGFEKGSKPINELRMLLLRSVRVSNVMPMGGADIAVSITIDIPSMDEIREVTPLPWASGRSWVDEVENGVSGLGNYIVKESPASRSGKAIQVKSQVRSASMGGVEYVSEIISNLINDITKNVQ